MKIVFLEDAVRDIQWLRYHSSPLHFVLQPGDKRPNSPQIAGPSPS